MKSVLLSILLFTLIGISWSETPEIISNEGFEEEKVEELPELDVIPTDIYEGCLKTKGCLANNMPKVSKPVMPSPCIKAKNCTSLITHKRENDWYRFELLAPFKGPDGYVAMGLSSDETMNTNCASTNKGLRDCTVIVEDGKIYCHFMRFRVIGHQALPFSRVDITDNKMYAILVVGNNVQKDKIEKHSKILYVTSLLPINFTKVNPKTKIDNTKIMVHIYSQIVCWIVIVPNSMFIARYLKETLNSCMCCNRRFWFVTHTTLMTMGFFVCVTSISFAMWHRSVIFDSTWPTISTRITHAQIGVSAAFLFMIQIISGWYRPQYDGKRTYSMFHAFIGTTAYILGNFNIGKSFYLGMPCYIYLLVCGEVIFLAFCHILMIHHFHWLDKKLGLKSCRALSAVPIRVVLYVDAPGAKYRKRIALLNFFGSVIFAVLISLMYYFESDTCICQIDDCKTTKI